jgi:hypothetical protein
MIIGRCCPIASQNSKQFLQNTYSYTVYDEIGRIIEVGELSSEIHRGTTYL